MKRCFKQILGLSALFIGALSVSAQGDYGRADFNLINSAPIFRVTGLPSPIDEIANLEVYDDDSEVYTDRSGKISGYTVMYIATYSDVVSSVTNGVGTNEVVSLQTNSVQNVESYNLCRVSGKMGTKGASAVARLSLKGSGPSATKTSTGKSKFTASYTGTSATNIILGTYNAKFTAGIKGIKNVSLKDIPARITDCSGTTAINDCVLYVYQGGNNLFSAGCSYLADYHSEFDGKGSYKNGKFNLNLNGSGEDRGIKFTLSGNAEGSLSGTNYISLTALTAKGKAWGQKVNTAAGTGVISSESTK